MEQDAIFCLECGSAALELPATSDGVAKCLNCNWQGPANHCVKVPGGANIHNAVKFMEDLRDALVPVLPNISQVLIRYGLMSQTKDIPYMRKQLYVLGKNIIGGMVAGAAKGHVELSRAEREETARRSAAARSTSN